VTPESFVRAWVRFYTTGLEPELRFERRAEIDSDLWEHRLLAADDRQSSTATSLAIWGRWAAGIPADLSWRVDQRRHKQPDRKELAVTNTFGRNWWQMLAVVAAIASGYLGVQQFVSDDVTPAVTPGKIGGLVVFSGGGALVLLGLALFRRYPRRGAGLVLIGLVPASVIGGLGLGMVFGLIAALIMEGGWWWLPVAIISAIATTAGIGAFGAWWHAAPARVGSSGRIVLVPAITIVAGLLAGFGAVGMGLELLGLLGAVMVGLGVVLWTRRTRSVS
jgi:hypothetical protein